MVKTVSWFRYCMSQLQIVHYGHFMSTVHYHFNTIKTVAYVYVQCLLCMYNACTYSAWNLYLKGTQWLDKLYVKAFQAAAVHFYLKIPGCSGEICNHDISKLWPYHYSCKQRGCDKIFQIFWNEMCFQRSCFSIPRISK